MKNLKSSALALLLITARGLAAETFQPAAESAAPALAARYELRVGAHTTDWYLLRTATRIESFNAGSRQGEIWARAPNGAIDYRRVFVDDRKIIEYSAGELRARGAMPRWEKLFSLVDPALVTRLRQTGERVVLGQHAQVLEGDLDDAPMRLWWLPEARLPARFERGAGDQLLRLELIELHAAAPAQWPQLGDDQVVGFGRLDAADFGDLEADPFVRKVLAQDGHEHGGHHHGGAQPSFPPGAATH